MTALVALLSLLAAPTVMPGGVVRGESCNHNMACCCPDHRTEKGIKATASSVLERKSQYGADKVLDRDGENYAGQLGTSWCEGRAGNGEGEWVKLDFPSPRPLQGLLISAGYDNAPDVYVQNGRLKALTLTLSDGTRYTLRFGPYFRPSESEEGGQVINSPQLFRLPKSRKHVVKWLKLEIAEVEPGTKFKDTCISTVVPHAHVEE